MLYKPLLGAQQSGSLGGFTASHNRGGVYYRTRTTPTDPQSDQQQVVRGLMSALAAHWTDTLDAAQRAAWETWSLNVPFPNPIGEMVNIGGLGAYVGANLPRLQADAALATSLGRIDDAPTVFNRGEGAPATITGSAAPTDISISFTASDGWANEVGGAVLIYTARPQSVGITYFAGPYRLAASILGAGMPPASPAARTAAFPFAAGNQVFVRTRQLRADGRWSPSVLSGRVNTA